MRELGATECAYYQLLIGVLLQIVELGRVDIYIEVSMMSLCLAFPRAGHLEQLYHIFKYLKIHHNAEIILDHSVPVVDHEKFEKMDWSNTVYASGDKKLFEMLPSNIPRARGEGFTMHAYVDSNNSGDLFTRRSHTEYFVDLNSALICWYSKKQTLVEILSF